MYVQDNKENNKGNATDWLIDPDRLFLYLIVPLLGKSAVLRTRFEWTWAQE